MRKSKNIQKKYDKTAGIYNSRYAEIQQEKYQKVLGEMDLRGRILDLGSGTGLLREFLKIDVVGADISMDMLLKGSGGRIQANAEKLPFKDKSFDYVLSFSMLMNSENPEKVIKEVRRILVKNGVFICTFLKSFDFSRIIKKHFTVLEKKDCGEDVCYILKP